MAAARRTPRALFALALTLARGGPLATAAIAIACVITFGFVAFAFSVARRGVGGGALAELPGLAASALAWGAGILFAFASAAHALRRDRAEGLRDLLRARAAPVRAYLVARVGALVLFVAILVVGGVLLTSIACVALAPRGEIARVLWSSGASLAYSAAFAAVVAPVAIAALGARSRAGGYLWLLAVLVVPELFDRWTGAILPYAWRDATSIPSVLGGLRVALMPPVVEIARVARDAVVLVVIGVLALLVVRQQVARVDREVRP